MIESIDQEIRALRSVFWSDRDPDGRAFVPLADAYRRAGDFRQAVELLNEGIERHPHLSSAHVVAARLYLEKGLVEEGELAARKVLDLDGENITGLELLAGSLEDRGAVEEAGALRARLADVLGVDRPEDAEVADLAELAPDEPEAAEVMDLGALAPDEPEAADEVEMMDLAALAPDEPEAADEVEVMDLGALAPDEPEADEEEAVEVMDLGALAPDEPEAEEEVEVMDLGALAPDEPEAAEEEAVEMMDLAALAPDEPEAAEEEAVEVMDLGALAPDEPEADEEETVEIMDLGALAPDEPEAAEEEVEMMDLAALAPDEPEAEEEVEVMDLGALAPATTDEVDDSDLPSDEVDDEPVVTRTMAELYASQGLTDRALEVFRQLKELNPGDSGLSRRIAELESVGDSNDEAGPADASSEDDGPTPEDEDLSGHAWDAEAQRAEHEVDTPFAWTAEEPEESASTGPSIGSYFERLLSWEPREGDES